MDYGHGEDKRKRSPSREDPWTKDTRPEDPWARDSRPADDHRWDRDREPEPSSYDRNPSRLLGSHSRDLTDERREDRSPFSRDSRGAGRTTRDERDSRAPFGRGRNPWDTDDWDKGKDSGRDWRDRSPMMRDKDKDRRRDRDRSRFSPPSDRGRGTNFEHCFLRGKYSFSGSTIPEKTAGVVCVTPFPFVNDSFHFADVFSRDKPLGRSSQDNARYLVSF